MYWEFSIPLDCFFYFLQGVSFVQVALLLNGVAFFFFKSTKDINNFKTLFEDSHISS